MPTTAIQSNQHASMNPVASERVPAKLALSLVVGENRCLVFLNLKTSRKKKNAQEKRTWIWKRKHYTALAACFADPSVRSAHATWAVLCPILLLL